MSVARMLQEFIEGLELTDGERDKASAQQTRLRAALRSGLAVDRDFLAGSYGRRTAIRPLNDIDVFVVLAGSRPRTPEEALREVFRVVKEAYPQTQRRTQARSIGLEFSGTGIGFDIVPAYEEWGRYLIPDRRAAQWIATDPEGHRLALTRANERTGGRLVPLIKVLKHWNGAVGRPLKSFHLEVMCYGALTREPSSHAAGLEALFSALVQQVVSRCPDPSGAGPDIDADLEHRDRVEAQKKLQEAADAARRANEPWGPDPEAAWRRLLRIA